MPAVESDTRTMKGLQALVIIMGVIIVAGLIVVVVTIANRMSGGSESAAVVVAPPIFDVVDLPIPAGCQIVETAIATDRLVLRLGSGERCNRVLIVDLGTGELLGSLRLVPTAQ